ncbi:Aste57867_11446 [Aphanomyces stellatus]|uniref:Mannosyltransferase n=1 Tax=Aphanomyces stellatus TaxID=120398 RepID=A0A485KT30_9STRA|nr:hypothetical protein As57867_011404 [Aphanomyces stellatus]VFT88307.1 Aste57867_11446 [Aphanomyces stellatus]
MSTARSRKSTKAAKETSPAAPPVAKVGKNAPIGALLREELQDLRLWAPNFHSAFSLLALVRLVSALFNIISDCDEVFNYWEPLHNLVHGFGFQTWEYSPVYGLRSYLYLIAHWLPAKLASIVVFGNTKLGFFFGLRAVLGFASAASEALFYRGIVHAFGPRVGRYTLAFLVFNSGLFLASTAFLPSSFVMYMLMLFSYAWMTSDAAFSVPALIAGVVAVLCGWPYVGVMCVPFFFDSLARFGFVRPVLSGIVVLAAVLALEVGVNYLFYHKWILPAFNIVLYNVVSSGSELYGTEPWHYYLQNLVLNFNVATALALAALPIMLLTPLARQRAVDVRRAVYLSPLFIWLAIMTVQAHKEERFLFPVYPLLCAAAAYTLSSAATVASAFVLPRRVVSLIVVALLVVYAALSTARIVSMSTQYGAPIRLYHHLATAVLPTTSDDDASTPVTVCVGKEWYRFPSHFFLPDHARLRFIRSGFRGQLPAYFNTTFEIPPHMNDENRDEPSRYVAVAACDYVVDRAVPADVAHPDEPGFDTNPAWELVHAESYLLSEQSHRLFRAFYVPFYTPQHVVFTDYALYGRKKQP